MRLSDSRAVARFRAELDAWLDENEPAADRAADAPRSPGHIPDWAADWQRTLFDAGWLVPRWPPELGGRDASAIEQMIYLEELSRRRVPRTVDPQGLDVCAPTLADHGSGRQVDEWLPATLHGEMSWCVAVGDVPDPGATAGDCDDAPGATSTGGLTIDEVDGAVVLRGSVPAPAGARDADRCLCAAVAESPRPDAMAVVAVDLTLDGVTRPDGEAGHLSFVALPLGPDAIVGERDEGWPVLQSVRARMRSVGWISSLLATQRALASLADLGRSRGLADDGVFRDTLAGLRVEADAVRALAYRALAKQATGRPNPELAMLPLATSRIEEHVYLTGVEVLGPDGLDLGVEGPMGWPSGSWASEWAAATGAVVASGGLGAERDRVAGRVLGVRLG